MHERSVVIKGTRYAAQPNGGADADPNGVPRRHRASRAQSVVSEIVDQLEKNGLLARVRDGADRRRTLVWLTDEARARLADEQEVLSLDVLERAMSRMTPRDRRLLLEGTRACHDPSTKGNGK